MTTAADRAQKLKLEGNLLHEKGDHQSAYEKYTEAIQQDPQNAVLFANRAAASLAMKEYLDAQQDAETATKLDPGYAKAWARLANAFQGLAAWDQCFSAWESALGCMPSQDLTDNQKKVQAQFREGLKASKAAKALPAPPKGGKAVPLGRGGRNLAATMKKMPWARAQAMATKKGLQEDSSAVVIFYAFVTYDKGAQDMKKLVKRNVKGEVAVEGVPTAIQSMSNGILIDRRCFAMTRDWIDDYVDQVSFEGEYYQAWGKQSPKLVCEQAPGRLKKEGWESVGPALCMTIRIWIMQGFITGNTGKHALSAQLYSSALEVIDWGREKWKDVPRSQRGDVFDILFRRQVNRLFIAAVMDVRCLQSPALSTQAVAVAWDGRPGMQVHAPGSGKDGQRDDPRELRTRFTKHNTTHNNIQAMNWHVIRYLFQLAQHLSTNTMIHSALGWFHMQLARKATTPQDIKIYLSASARYYTLSASTFPADDEYSVFFLSIALDALRQHGTPLRDTLAVCKRIRRAIPDVLKIWEVSGMSERRDDALEKVAEWERACGKGLATGKFTQSSCVDRL
ncbi:hypothetical protein FB45DRAFT_1009828 [Roridomyces roridus]|uniref:Uncharacterized protein n=1 Tax=Roridomyces roridus TaxID=1738132 RepID=A0AAD7B4Z2_9AGAR|nr:hypothetical protein FB45DRAFT_1009828 [Roridomyces roridus]